MKGSFELNSLSLEEIQSLLKSSRDSSLFKQDIVCPLDSSHVFDISRIESHVSDCRRRNAHLGLLPCPFSKYHFFTPTDRERHINGCPDAKGREVKQDPAIHKEAQKEISMRQIIELKLQCGLPLTPEEHELLTLAK